MRTSTSVAVFVAVAVLAVMPISTFPVATGLMVITDLLVAFCATLAAEMVSSKLLATESVRRADSRASANVRAVAASALRAA